VPLPKLESFHLLEKLLTGLPNKLLQNQGSIRELKIKGDKIRVLNVPLFANLTSLNTLHLISMDFGRTDSKETVGLPSGIFDDLPALRNFSLIGRGIENLPEDLFSKNKNLERVEFMFFTCSDKSPCHVKPNTFVKNVASLQVRSHSNNTQHFLYLFSPPSPLC
jgi:hypothetical protein